MGNILMDFMEYIWMDFLRRINTVSSLQNVMIVIIATQLLRMFIESDFLDTIIFKIRRRNIKRKEQRR